MTLLDTGQLQNWHCTSSLATVASQFFDTTHLQQLLLFGENTNIILCILHCTRKIRSKSWFTLKKYCLYVARCKTVDTKYNKPIRIRHAVIQILQPIRFLIAKKRRDTSEACVMGNGVRFMCITVHLYIIFKNQHTHIYICTH